jgi:predicted site-specific integrase-resolvase
MPNNVVKETQGRTIEVVNVAENDKEDLIADLVATVGQTQNRTACPGIAGK